MADAPTDRTAATPDRPVPPGTLRSIAVACAPDTRAAHGIVDLAAAPPVRVRDGDRWTAYAAGDLTVALASADELPDGATVSLNVKVTDVRASLATLVAAGAEAAGEVTEGGHEIRGAVWLSPGVALSIYQPR